MRLSLRQMMTMFGWLVAAPFAVSGQTVLDSPESVIRSFVRAMYANDAVSFRKLALPDRNVALLLSNGKVNEDGLRELAEDPQGLQIIGRRTFEYMGAKAVTDKSGRYPVGTTVVYMIAHHRSPMVMTLRREPDGWKVDPRWWVAMVQMATGGEDKPGSPQYAARALLASVVAMQRQSALKYSTPGTNLDVLFYGGPSQPEPSGHIDALVMEMPLVELAVAEYRRLHGGAIVQGSSVPDRKVLSRNAWLGGSAVHSASCQQRVACRAAAVLRVDRPMTS